MWPKGPDCMDTVSDKAWQEALGGKSYMMGVSPWFFHSANRGKNWIWRSDDLWAHRWAQTIEVAPHFIQYANPSTRFVITDVHYYLLESPHGTTLVNPTTLAQFTIVRKSLLDQQLMLTTCHTKIGATFSPFISPNIKAKTSLLSTIKCNTDTVILLSPEAGQEM